MAGDTPDSLVAEGYRARRENRLADAQVCFAEAVDLYRTTDDKLQLAQALAGLGQIARDLGDTGAAVQHYRASVDLFRTQPDALALAHTVRHLGDILRHRGDLAESARCYEEALTIYGDANAPRPLDLANAIRGYALLKVRLGDPKESARLWRRAGELYESVGVESGVAESKAQIASLTEEI